MSDRNEEINQLAEAMLNDNGSISEVMDRLAEAPRRDRQIVAAAVRIAVKSDPDPFVEYIPVLVEALNRPEAQTRWECLEALTLLVDNDSRACGKALPEAESALFDEESGPVRLAAMRFLCKIGATTAARSEKAWPLIDEGIQCYHGDLEFNDMLVAINEFASGKLSDQVKAQLKDRMSFDATSGKGSLKRKAQQIIDSIA